MTTKRRGVFVLPLSVYRIETNTHTPLKYVIAVASTKNKNELAPLLYSLIHYPTKHIYIYIYIHIHEG